LADYIPELAKADPNSFGICIATRDGHLYEVGDTRLPFTIQSISKALVYGLALEDRGEDAILSKIGVEPSGDAFNAISLRAGTGAPFNPMINAGAIAVTGQVVSNPAASRIDRIIEYLSRCAGRNLSIDEDVQRSESETGHRNRAIGWMLRNFGILDEDPTEALEAYFKQCSIRVTCADLAVMGATLANQGVNPITGERAIAHEFVDNVLGVMATCGMYDWSGEWIYRVGLPAKSGVAGGILAVLPGQLGIGVFSPLLDSQGNSVRGIRVCMDLTRELALHLFNPSAVHQPALRQMYNATQVVSRRRLPPAALQMLNQYGERIRVLELHGPLLFATFEPVIRQLVEDARSCQDVVLDFRHVVSADQVSLRMLREIQQQLGTTGVRLLCCHAGKFADALEAVGVPKETMYESDDAALEACEDELLGMVMPGTWEEQQPVPLDRCSLFSGCDWNDLKLLSERMPVRTFSQGEVIIRTGSVADELFILVAGKVEVCLSHDSKRSQRLDVLSAGMCFGEMAFLDGSPRSADVVALERTECRVLDRDLFEQLDRSRPGLKIKVLTQLNLQLCSRLRQANVQIAALRGGNAGRKAAKTHA
jgi:glutaminase